MTLIHFESEDCIKFIRIRYKVDCIQDEPPIQYFFLNKQDKYCFCSAAYKFNLGNYIGNSNYLCNAILNQTFITHPYIIIIIIL